MTKLSQWPWSRVLLVSALWVLAILSLLAWQLYSKLRWVSRQTEQQGIAAASMNIGLLVLLLLGPPLVLVCIWYLAGRGFGT